MQIEVPAFPPERFVPEPDDACPECHGRGWRVVDDGGAGRAERCACQEREQGELLLKRARIPLRYRDCSLGNFETMTSKSETRIRLEAAKETSERYVHSFDLQQAPEAGLIYIGLPGTGKTHLAAAVLSAVVQRQHVRGLFVDFTSLIQQIQATFDPSSGESKHSVIDPVIGAQLLVFDELGAQKPTAWVMDTLYYILNTRYTRRLPTIFTTNYPLARSAAPSAPGGLAEPWEDARWKDTDPRIHKSAEEAESQPLAPRLLEERISAALVSRLHQMAVPVKLEVSDYRLRERARIGR